jgi:hyperosmotically inducible protein
MGRAAAPARVLASISQLPSWTDRRGGLSMKQLLSGLTTLVLAVAVFFVAESPAAGRTPGETVSDAAITAAVKAKLTADTASNLVKVNVDTTKGTVYLNGAVQTAEQKARAEELARETRGVQTVVNNLAVQPR